MRSSVAVLTEKALVEEQNAILTMLRVSGVRLQEATRREEVIQAIEEIVANLLGSEEVAVFLLDPSRRALHLVGAAGVDPEPLREIAVGDGLIGETARSGARWVSDGGPLPDRAAAREAHLTACLPLRVGSRVTGAVAIFRLLPQKDRLEPGDDALLEQLETAAATALFVADHEAGPPPEGAA